MRVQDPTVEKPCPPVTVQLKNVKAETPVPEQAFNKENYLFTRGQTFVRRP